MQDPLEVLNSPRYNLFCFCPIGGKPLSDLGAKIVAKWPKVTIYSGVREDFETSHFFLWTPWDVSEGTVVELMRWGVIPVLLSDNKSPFSQIPLVWDSFSVRVTPNSLEGVGQILSGIPRREVALMHRRSVCLWECLLSVGLGQLGGTVKVRQAARSVRKWGLVESKRKDQHYVVDFGEGEDIRYELPVKVVHIVSPGEKEGTPLWARQCICLPTLECAASGLPVKLMAGVTAEWARPLWEVVSLPRDSRVLGAPVGKPFLHDLLDIAASHAAPGDWLVYSNSDCGVSTDFYQNLLSIQGTTVEYIRQDVESPVTSTDLFKGGKLYSIGVDAIAIRCQYWHDIEGEIPDLVVGEPHWDTTMHGILCRLGSVCCDTKRLFHVNHKQVWSNSSLNRAGQHNKQAMDEAWAVGEMKYRFITPLPERDPETAIIVVSYGTDEIRAAAARVAMESWRQQDLVCDIYVVEMLLKDQPSVYKDIKGITWFPQYCKRANLDLWQKEALMNLGWTKSLDVGPYENFIFVDADVFCLRWDWWRSIRSRLGDMRVCQGFRFVEDSADPSIAYVSLSALQVLGVQSELRYNPGMVWGVSRSVLEAGGGFNPYFLDGGGDSGFVSEYLASDSKRQESWLWRFGWFKGIHRNLGITCKADCVTMDIIHANHGSYRDRCYKGIRATLDLFVKEIRDMVFVNKDGLLEWVDPTCRERSVMRRRPEMFDRKVIDQIFQEEKCSFKG